MIGKTFNTFEIVQELNDWINIYENNTDYTNVFESAYTIGAINTLSKLLNVEDMNYKQMKIKFNKLKHELQKL